MKTFQLNKVYCALLIALNLASPARANPPVGASASGTQGNLTLDNSLGNPAGGIPKNSNNVYHVNAANYGVFSSSGKNVFFSFSQFLIDRAESAVFSCSAGCANTSNVISRVNGNPAEVYGNLTSTIHNSANAGAAFYLLSDQGVIFGKNASLNLPAALHVGATNTLNFGNGQKLDNTTNSDTVSSLNGNPLAFGFLSGPGKIVIGEDDKSGRLASTLTIQTNGTAEFSGGTVEIANRPGAAGDTVAVDANTGGGNVVIKAGGADSGGVSAVTQRSGTRLSVAGGGSASVQANNADGSVTIEDGATLLNASRLQSVASDVTVAGKANAQTTLAGGDLTVTGNLNASKASAGGLLKVSGGGVLQNPDSGNLTVAAPRIQVDGAGSKITLFGSGSLRVEATAADPAGGSALSVSNGGQISGNNTQGISVLADQGTVEVGGADSKINGGNTGSLNVGAVGEGGTTKLVWVHDGGVIEKTAGANLAVRGQAVLVEGAGSQIIAAPKAVGALQVQAVGADGSIADPANTGAQLNALTLRGNGQIVDNHTGDTNIWASATDGTGAAAGSVEINGGGITGANSGQTNIGFLGTGDSKLVWVHGGGGIDKTQGPGMTVKGDAILVEGKGSHIATASAPTGAFRIIATGRNSQVADPSNAGQSLNALTLRNSGVIKSNQSGGNMTVLAANPAGSVEVASQARIVGANSGNLDIGFTGSQTSNQVWVHEGGIIEKTAGGNMTVKANTVLVQNAGSQIATTADPAGTFRVEAANAINVSDGGQITGRQSGNMTVLTSNPAGTLEVNNGKITSANSGSTTIGGDAHHTDALVWVHNGGSIEKTQGTGLTVKGQAVLVENAGSQISTTSAPKGSFQVQASSADNTIADPTNEGSKLNAITVRDGGQIVGRQKGAMSVVPSDSTGSVVVTGGTITGANSGNLTVGALDGQNANQVLVQNGGVIEKTKGAALTVKGGEVLVNGAGAAIKTNPAAVGGFRVEGGLAVNVVNGGQIQGGQTGNMVVLASSAGGTVQLDNGKIIGANSGMTSVGYDANHVGKLVYVSNGSLIEKTQGTGLAVQSQAVLVDGAGSQIKTAAAPTGEFRVEATGADNAVADPAEGPRLDALTVRNGGEIVGKHANSMNLLASNPAGSVEVDKGKIIGANSGATTVGSNGTGSSELIWVHDGGVIAKTNGSHLTVKGQAVLVEDAGSKIRTSAGPNGVFLVEATGADNTIADPSSTTGASLNALTVRNNGLISSAQTGGMAVWASAGGNAAGSVEVGGKGRISAANSEQTSVGFASGSASKQVWVHGGGVIAKTGGGNLAVKGQAVLVEGADSQIKTSAGTNGSLRVEAVGADNSVADPSTPGATLDALTVRNQGQILAAQTGSATVLASASNAGLPSGTVNVDQGKITGLNTGNLNVGFSKPASLSKLVWVHDGGIINKTQGASLNVEGQAVLVEGAGSQIKTGPAATGNLLVEARGADNSVADPSSTTGGTINAVTVRDNGQIVGQNTGSMAVWASGTDTESNPNGTVEVAGKGQIVGANARQTGVGLDNAGGTSKLVWVHDGGVIKKTQGTDLGVEAQAVLVENAGSQITTGTAPTGTLLVSATGADNSVADPSHAGATLDALSLRDSGQIVGKHAGNMAVLASSPNGTVNLDNSQIIAANAGSSSVGYDGSHTSKLVWVHDGATIEKTAGNNLTVSGQAVLVENANSKIETKAAAGGNFLVQAGGADSSGTDPSSGGANLAALTVRDNAQIIGNQTGGAMLVQAASGTANVQQTASIQRLSNGALSVNAGAVQVDGLLQSRQGDLVIASNPAFQTTTPAAGGTISAGRDLQASGNLSAGILSAGRNMAIAGQASVQNVTRAGVAIALTGQLTTQQVTAGQSLSVSGPNALLSGANQVTAGGQLAVTNGGTIQNTGTGDFSVSGASIAVVGANSKISKSGSGNFTVQAQGGDSAESAALSVANGGQIVGSQTGDMAVLASAGTINVDGENAVLANNQGATTINAQTLAVGNSGAPAIGLNNGGQATLNTDVIKGSGMIGATNAGDLQVNSLNGNSLSINGTTLEKDNAQGNIQLQAPSLSLTNSTVNLFSNPPPNSTNLVEGGNITLKSDALQLTGAEIRNRGLGEGAAHNNIRLDTGTLQMANSVVETRTNPNGLGGNIVIAHGDASDTKIVYGTALTGQFQPTGAADFRVVPLSLPNIGRANAASQDIFATTHPTKLPSVTALEATNVVQAQVLVPIDQWQTHVSLDELRANPCGKAGSSLTVSGTSGFAAQPRLSMPLPRKNSTSTQPAPRTLGTASSDGDALKLASLHQSDVADCN